MMNNFNRDVLFLKKEVILKLLLLFFLSVIALANFNVFAQDSTAPATGKFDMQKVINAMNSKQSIEKQTKASVPKTSLTAVTIRMIIALSVILLLIAAAVFVFKKIAYSNVTGSSKSGIMDVLESISIAPGKSISLVRVSDKVIIVGIAGDNIRNISEFTGEKALEIIKTAGKNTSGAPFAQFSESLNMFMDKFKKSPK